MRASIGLFLGALPSKGQLPNSADLNDYRENGSWYHTGGNNFPSNSPISSGTATIFYIKSADNYGVQYYNANNSGFFVRVYFGDWGNWKRIDNFGCNTLAELKAALAAV